MESKWVKHIIKNGGNWTYEIRTRKPHNPAGSIGKHIATVNTMIEAQEQGTCDLIASAPELLSTLEKICTTPPPNHTAGSAEIQAYSTLFKSAETLILKAKGYNP